VPPCGKREEKPPCAVGGFSILACDFVHLEGKYSFSMNEVFVFKNRNEDEKMYLL